MKIQLLAVGQKMPAWVTTGFETYQKRLPQHCALHLTEITAGIRSKNTPPAQAIISERDRLMNALDNRSHLVCLDERGKSWTTRQLSTRLSDWMSFGQPISLMVGGPDGLHSDCLTAANERWSLGPLTLPHPLVRVLLAEQLYRAWSLLNGHPYHRD